MDTFNDPSVPSIIAAVTGLLTTCFLLWGKYKDSVWRRDDIIHKHKLELIAAESTASLEAAKVQAELAVKEAETLKKLIIASQSERASQMNVIVNKVRETIAKVDANTKVNEAAIKVSEEAIKVSNNVNYKIESYGKDLANADSGKMEAANVTIEADHVEVRAKDQLTEPKPNKLNA